MENLGKPLHQHRVRGRPLALNGQAYGVGADDRARLFSFDPAHGVYEILGMVDVNHRPYYARQAYVIDSMALGNDGTVFLGRPRVSRNSIFITE
jgi:hypothetical protein